MSRNQEKRAASLRGLVWVGLAGMAAVWAWTRPWGGKPVAVGGPRRPRSATGETASRTEGSERRDGDVAPGDDHDAAGGVVAGLKGYSVGLALAGLLTVLSFAMPGNSLVWPAAIPAALIVFAIGQMGVHLVFFLHINTEPDHTNNVMALAFGLVIVLLLIGGSLWIMSHLAANMMPTDQMLQMQR